ncbi:ATP phosphoribosyltransferase regulatory subunit, partial [Candidatus Saccharibacteria bacterium]|nr:ATP phosphoribosyltransferase regulatory subunit [Candidatus Saccharibacteria bacterium]
LAGFLQALNLSDKAEVISSVIDHAEKVSEEQSKSTLKEAGLTDEQVQKVCDFMFTKGNFDEVSERLRTILGDLSSVQAGLDELKEVTSILETKKTSNYIIDFMIIRGLDYYTGTVFETMLEDYREIGSIASGGRYENLCGNFTDQGFPGVGGSIGLTRLFFVLREYNLVNMTTKQPVDYVIFPLSSNEYKASFELADRLREQGKTVDVDLSDRKLGDKFNRAGKIADFAVVIGNDEVISQKFNAKNLRTGETSELCI